MCNKLFKFSGRKIILIELQIILYMKLLGDLLPVFNILEIIIDLLNIALVGFIFLELKHSGSSIKRMGSLILFFLLYCLLSCFIFEPNLILFLWGLRNKFRFLIVFLAASALLKKEDINYIFDKMYLCLLINMPIITYQFLDGVGRDYLGGTFGIQKNCNSSINILLTALCSYSFISKIKKEENTKKLLLVMLCSIYWAGLAEIKIFFVELMIIVFLSFLIINGQSLSKFRGFFLVSVMFVFGAVGLHYVYPEQTEFIFNPQSILWYLSNVHGGAYGFGRTTALSMITDLFFNNDPLKVLFGIGVGNAEFLTALNLNCLSEFYTNYQDYAYFWYFHSMVYLEMGVVGILWYVCFWMHGFWNSIKYKYMDTRIMVFSTIFYVCTLINAFKDSTLLISVSGYMSFLLLALPFICINRFKYGDLNE